MKAISDTRANKEPLNIMEQVCEDHSPVIITRGK
ncbi:type II toxin-antitoxin system Phd/YefM family antitoxin [Halomonas sp. GD1P12]|nr:type II toxin-antitoxin system Phd/YefM family antitoxin [Halomonas sp. GD1P12]UYG00847.1 type II toxin-antitoxin system Phd/YefM family antitoxin [Halomonas sp. GD1P12]